MLKWSKMFELYFHFWKWQNLCQKSVSSDLLLWSQGSWAWMNFVPKATTWFTLAAECFWHAFEMHFIRNGFASGFQYLDSGHWQCIMPRGPDCCEVLGTTQHTSGFWSALCTIFGPLWCHSVPQPDCCLEEEKISEMLCRYISVQQSSCRPFWSRNSTDALKSERIAAITAYRRVLFLKRELKYLETVLVYVQQILSLLFLISCCNYWFTILTFNNFKGLLKNCFILHFI